jgi:hypothetical protein
VHALLAAVVIPTPGFHEAKPLEPAASFVAGKPAIVWCANSESSWRAFLTDRYSSGASTDVQGSADIAQGKFWLSPIVCKTLGFAAISAQDAIHYPSLAPSVAVLTHESIHLRGETDEGVTDCDAMHEMPRLAVKFFHVTAGKKLRALMAAAWAWHRAPTGNPIYRSVC